jgi:hypothetical protein
MSYIGNSPANCRWETPIEQMRNTRRNVLTHNDTPVEMTDAEVTTMIQDWVASK